MGSMNFERSCNAVSSLFPHSFARVAINTDSIVSQTYPNTTSLPTLNTGALVQADLQPRPILILRDNLRRGYLSERGYSQSASLHLSTPTEASFEQLSDRPTISRDTRRDLRELRCVQCVICGAVSCVDETSSLRRNIGRAQRWQPSSTLLLRVCKTSILPSLYIDFFTLQS